MTDELVNKLVEQGYLAPTSEWPLEVLMSYFQQSGISVYEENGMVVLKEIETPLNQDIIESYLSELKELIPYAIDIHQLIGSTNSYLRSRAKTAQLPLVCFAEYQTDGHGRRGNSWVASYGEDICCSLAWEIPNGYQLSGAESLLMALTLAETLEKIGVNRVQVKWPNDIYVKGKKISGILLEQIYNSGRAILIVGIGINMVEHFKDSDHVGFEATSIASELELTDRNRIAALVTKDILKALSTITPTLNERSITRWSELDYLKGKTIEIEHGDVSKGRYIGIDKNGRLLLECGGETILVSSGHITEISS